MRLATAIESILAGSVRGGRAAARFIRADRRRMLGVAALALGLGSALNWGWLVAVGIAPVIVGALPCVAMCALGLCMSGAAARCCATEPSTPRLLPPPDAASAATPIQES